MIKEAPTEIIPGYLQINTMLRPVYILTLIYLIVSFSLSGNINSKWIPVNLSNEQGLSNSAITCILKDADGVMWFGSWDGLNRYDGTAITVFKPDFLDTKSLSNNIIRNLLEDKYHNMWVISNKDIDRYKSANMTFESYFSGNEFLPVREQNLEACIGPDSTLYVSLRRFGLYFYEHGANRFRELDLTGISEADSKNIIGISGGRNNSLYLLGSGGSLFAYSKHEEYKKEYEKELGGYAELTMERHWFIQGEKTSYLAINIASGGIFLLDLETQQVQKVGVGVNPLNVTSLDASAGSNEFWLGTDNGSVYKLDLNKTPELTCMDENMPELTSNNVKIWTIRQTGDDLLWIGTDGNGVYRYVTKAKAFFNLKKGDAETGSLGHNIVRSIYRDAEGNLWVGTRGDGLNKLDAETGSRFSYTLNNGLSNNAVLSLNMDMQKNLWIGVDGEGIDMLESSSGKIFHFPKNFTKGLHPEFGNVYSICIDVYGSIWLGTNGFGLVNMEVKKDGKGNYELSRYRQFRYELGQDGLNSDIVYSIVEEGPNVIWIGTRGGGLHRMNTLNSSFEIFGVRKNAEKQFIDDDILSLCMGSDQKLWIGTSQGLSVLNLSYKPYQFLHFTERNGMPNNTVHGILEDEAGQLWISTNRGLSNFVPSRSDFLNFNKTDGLQNSEYTDGAYFKDPLTHVLYFGGIEGLDWFDPQQIEASTNFPPIILNEFRLNNMLIVPTDSTNILPSSLNTVDHIDLKYKQNFFSISFTSLNYYNARKCGYSYILEGFTDAWIEAGEQGIAAFTNVPPGSYTLKIMASNEDGIYGTEIRELPIMIQQPYWNTFTAYVVYLVLLWILIAVFIRIYRRRTREHRKVELAQQEQSKADEINQYKLRFFTDIAHEFRTPLTLILAPAAIMEEQLAGRRRLGSYARSIVQNAAKLQKLISELIEFRKVETRNVKLSFQRYDLVRYTAELVKAFEIYEKVSNVSLNFLHESASLTAWIDPDKYERIVLNLLSNAIKYTPRGGNVEIELKDEDLYFHLIVRDTGIGIPEESIDNIFDRFYHHGGSSQESRVSQESGGVGLSLTKGLVELHQGTIRVRNLPGGGSEFHVMMPRIQQGHDLSGTVELQLPSSDKIALKVEVEFQAFKTAEMLNEHENPSTELRQYTVLVVDDNDEVCTLVESMLKDTYRVFTASEGNSALEILHSRNIDLVISDIVMQGMDGIDLARRIKNDPASSHIPLIMLTAKGEIEDRIVGLEVGADSYIPKPFHPRHLMIRVEKLISAREQFRKTFRELDENIGSSELLKVLTPYDRELIRSLESYINENLQHSGLNANSLAKHIAMSKTQLYRKIKALTGLTPHGLINQLRLKKAAHTLKTGQKTVSEVYYETGFNSRSYFYQAFKETYGVPPGGWARSKEQGAGGNEP